MNEGSEKRKLVIVGDGACGKTSLLIVYVKGEFPEEYVPTVFENYVADVEIDGRHIELTLWDTAGQEEYDRLRPLSYPNANVILICFALDNAVSLSNVTDRWLPEVKHFCKDLPILLIGLKKDLRDDPNAKEPLEKRLEQAVSFNQGLAISKKINAYRYLECSAKMVDGVKEVFETAARASLVKKTASSSKKHCLIL